MKFVTYVHEIKESIGILENNNVFDIKDLLKKMGEKDIPGTMQKFIEYLDEDKSHKMELFLNNRVVEPVSLDSVKLKAPIPYPRRNVFCLGKNYEEHAREIKMTQISGNGIPEVPIYFTKVASPAVGTGDYIKFSTEVTKQVDYEAELGVIMGKDGADIKLEDAEKYIFGYTIINDVSARDLQGKHVQWFKGKSLDTFCPMGPCIVYKDEIPFPVELDIKCMVNGEVRQNSNTKNLIFDIPHIISDLSRGLTLKAGDIISTGTPSGVGMGFEPVKVLKNGDVVECRIEKVGSLVNHVVETL
ncbi:fumarylacetoacetate hydrolase family protein [Clostridium luticellarii]|jgi:2-keto-4-pentenoate hydratase/2-oxohepta-3-ene-1,7-dioic acid hydratase in catechol pathway|uniref:Ureidoglycolate lyase n=1 Tax=Clostridium luticellarii TaxID=1691940 RepID=A0A2T0BAU7_9CLOT|nr:fumarylacetoacetate hydrolase family protein [Clostridium luticellarii]MCI1946460.1 fumarylacetoacetate hydrolase family protein [Clostridium luticellarii]MCI1967456.1 fumarylacetoacetate hydrolase family protein [Clostridium luticellarii]MCI1996917.1 fumarylacetoacetate hydrolase family protein [Clostridium luticellarii]MCI2041037.1 fumarylacetoacetate hydrolase family protein [Clostridium luticellarii]PRR80937.1 Ureidoglycolate lyase [Clostridium luticellarii]